MISAKDPSHGEDLKSDVSMFDFVGINGLWVHRAHLQHEPPAAVGFAPDDGGEVDGPHGKAP